MSVPYTPWFPRSLTPTRVGVYQTSRDVVVQGRNIKDLGNGYAYWNGLYWEDFGRWGNHMKMNVNDAVWRGLRSKRAQRQVELVPKT